MIYSIKKMLPLLFVTLLISSCEGPNGPDGNNGKAYIKITSSDGYLFLYGDDNPSIPVIFVIGQNYQTGVGTYLFAYESRIYTSPTTYSYQQWLGTYSITINYGTKGGKGKLFWQEGEAGQNGKDKYFTLYCNYNGPEQSIPGKQGTIPSSEIGETKKWREQKGDFLFEAEFHLKEKGVKKGQ